LGEPHIAMATQVVPAGMSSERLTDQEAQYMTVGPSISTITFFRGSTASAKSTLRERLGAVVAANPWLAGTLTKQKGKMHVTFPTDPNAEQVDALFNPTHRAGKKKKVPVVDSTMDYISLCKAVSGSAAEILKGSDSVAKGDQLLALTVLPDAKKPDDTFAIVFSVSHAIIDGFTYYKLLTMLSSGGAVAPLSAVRKHDIGPQSKVAMGKQESAFAYSGATVCNVVCSMLCGKRALIESYYVDPVRVDAMKTESSSDTGVKFVSTNDILCSTFANATKARVLLMPLNFRERLPDFTAEDAGNYEGALVFGPDDYADPSLIRKTLQTGPPAYLRGGGVLTTEPLPSGCAAMRCRIAMCVSWAFSFFDDVKIDGCKQMMHIPHCDVNMIPFNIAVVYRPRSGELAVAFFVRNVDSKGIMSGLPVGDLVPSAEQSFARKAV